MSAPAGDATMLEGVGALLRATGAVAVSRAREDVVALVDAGIPNEREDAVVVVVGERGRGKSRFINALLGQDVSPTDVEHPAPAYLLLHHGADLSARVRRLGASALREAPPEAIGTLLEADAPEHPDGPVVYIELAVPNELLAHGLALIDAPGVGGLEAAHAEATLAVLKRADALIFILDAGAPISMPELRFLQRAATGIGAVLLVLTKIDAYLGWEEILAEDRALLAEHVPQFAAAPFFAVSSTEKQEADAIGDEEVAAESGVPAVEDGLVSGVIRGRTRLRLLNAMQAVRNALDALDAPERAISTVVADRVEDGSPDGAAIALAAFEEDTRDWHATLTVAFQRDVANHTDFALRKRIAGITRKFETRINTSTGGRTDLERLLGETVDVAKMREEVTAELQALATEMDTLVLTSALQVLSTTCGGLRLDTGEADGVNSAGEPPALSFADPVPQRQDLSQRLRNLSLVSSPSTAGRVLGPVLGTGALLGAGVGAVFGGLLVFGAEWFRRQAESRAEATTLVRDAVGQAHLEIDHHVRNRLIETQHAVQSAVVRALDARRASLRAMADDERALRAADDAQRQATLERAGRNLEETEPLWRAAHELTDRLIGSPRG